MTDLKFEPITDHHDGFGLAECMVVNRNDDMGPGGAYHKYSVDYVTKEATIKDVAEIQFQKGPRDEAGSTPGIIEGVLVAILLDRLRAFQDGPYKCRENALVITHLEEAMHWIHHRARERSRRGVLGTSKT
jgi:hypothetical protein